MMRLRACCDLGIVTLADMPITKHIIPNHESLRVRRYGGTRNVRGHIDTDLRIAHITDQHVGRLTDDNLQRRAVDVANEAGADLVFLTGDFVAHDLDHLDQLEGYLRSLDARAFAVLGNHDHWTGADAVRDVLRRADVEVLDNAWTTVRVGSSDIQVVGLDDVHTGNHDIDKATRGLDENLPSIALSHVGDAADALWDAGVELVFSGHTHAGQVIAGDLLERVFNRITKARYIHGLYGCRDGVRKPGALYVSAGIGSSRFSPRLGERGKPEVAIFDMHAVPNPVEEPFLERPAHGASRYF